MIAAVALSLFTWIGGTLLYGFIPEQLTFGRYVIVESTPREEELPPIFFVAEREVEKVRVPLTTFWITIRDEEQAWTPKSLPNLTVTMRGMAASSQDLLGTGTSVDDAVREVAPKLDPRLQGRDYIEQPFNTTNGLIIPLEQLDALPELETVGVWVFDPRRGYIGSVSGYPGSLWAGDLIMQVQEYAKREKVYAANLVAYGLAFAIGLLVLWLVRQRGDRRSRA